MKEALINTAIGRMASRARDFAELHTALWRRLEMVGSLANDQLATRLICRLCLPQRTFIDVGAHIGSIAAEVSHRDSTIRVIAVEAIPEKVAHLRARLPQVEVHACAVSEAEGEATFYVHTQRSGFSSLGRPGPGDAGVREIRVPVQRLDQIAPARGVDAVKVDVEGAELGVLRGAERLLAESRPTLMFESAPEREDGLAFTREGLFAFLAERDYRVVLPNRLAHEDEGMSQDGFVESHVHPRRTTNYFAVARERRVEVRDRARILLGIRSR